jgi:hypothetical protein
VIFLYHLNIFPLISKTQHLNWTFFTQVLVRVHLLSVMISVLLLVNLFIKVCRSLIKTRLVSHWVIN